MNTFLIIFVALLGAINMFTCLIFTIMLSFEYDNDPPLFVQQYLCDVLDDYNINWIGKAILCVLTMPFTIFYTVATLIFWKIGVFIAAKLWKLFCTIFQKK